MNLEIHKPELIQRVNAQIRSGQFQDVDELIEKALEALEERNARRAADGDRCGRAGGVTGFAIPGY